MGQLRTDRGGSQAALLRALAAVHGVTWRAAVAVGLRYRSLLELTEAVERCGAQGIAAACMSWLLEGAPSGLNAAAIFRAGMPLAPKQPSPRSRCTMTQAIQQWGRRWPSASSGLCAARIELLQGLPCACKPQPACFPPVLMRCVTKQTTRCICWPRPTFSSRKRQAPWPARLQQAPASLLAAPPAAPRRRAAPAPAAAPAALLGAALGGGAVLERDAQPLVLHGRQLRAGRGRGQDGQFRGAGAEAAATGTAT